MNRSSDQRSGSFDEEENEMNEPVESIQYIAQNLQQQTLPLPQQYHHRTYNVAQHDGFLE